MGRDDSLGRFASKAGVASRDIACPDPLPRPPSHLGSAQLQLSTLHDFTDESCEPISETCYHGVEVLDSLDSE